MKKWITPFLFVLAATTPFVTAQKPAGEEPQEEVQDQQPPQPKSLLLGQRPNAEVTLYDLDGKPQRAGDLMGKITVVNFFSIQCPIQRAWNDRLVQIQKDFGAKEVVFLHINSNVTEIGAEAPVRKDEEESGDESGDGDAKPGAEQYAKVVEFLKKNELPFRVFADHGNVVADMFQAKTTPHIYVFGRDGRLCYKGLVDDDQKNRRPDSRNDYLRDVLQKLVDGEKVEPFETKEEGCSIKRVKKDAKGAGERGNLRGRGARR